MMSFYLHIKVKSDKILDSVPVPKKRSEKHLCHLFSTDNNKKYRVTISSSQSSSENHEKILLLLYYQIYSKNIGLRQQNCIASLWWVLFWSASATPPLHMRWDVIPFRLFLLQRILKLNHYYTILLFMGTE